VPKKSASKPTATRHKSINVRCHADTEYCGLPAYVAASSDDGGATYNWLIVCEFHRDGWNDDGDWQAPIYALGERKE
jgi:hypothetical protein